MNKKIIMVLCIAVCLVTGSALVFQQVAVAAGYYAHKCWIPYNIKGGAWNTGIHIYADYYSSENFKISFVNGTGRYRTVYLDMADSPGGWTGTIEGLFNLPTTDPLGEDLPMDKEDPEITAPFPESTFTSPSLLLIYSYSSKFMVSQFIINSITGYGFQTFYSWPYSMVWPYVDTTPLPEVVSEPMMREGDCVDCD